MSTSPLQALKAQAPFLTGSAFSNPQTSNGVGMAGELQARSACGQFRVEASLSKDHPDAADEELRSQCSLDVSLETADGEPLYAFTGMAYEYHGDSPGEHLAELLREDEGGLLQMLFDEVFATSSR